MAAHQLYDHFNAFPPLISCSITQILHDQVNQYGPYLSVNWTWKGCREGRCHRYPSSISLLITYCHYSVTY